MQQSNIEAQIQHVINAAQRLGRYQGKLQEYATPLQYPSLQEYPPEFYARQCGVYYGRALDEQSWLDYRRHLLLDAVEDLLLFCCDVYARDLDTILDPGVTS